MPWDDGQDDEHESNSGQSAAERTAVTDRCMTCDVDVTKRVRPVWVWSERAPAFGVRVGDRQAVEVARPETFVVNGSRRITPAMTKERIPASNASR
jgi:hypothetical protein